MKIDFSEIENADGTKKIAPLFDSHENRPEEPLFAFIEIDKKSELVSFGKDDWNMTPLYVFNGKAARIAVPAAASSEALREFVEREDVQALFKTIIKGGEAANEAEHEIETLAYDLRTDDVCEAGDWLENVENKELLGLSDKELKAKADEFIAFAESENTKLVGNVLKYLESRRAEANETAKDKKKIIPRKPQNVFKP